MNTPLIRSLAKYCTQGNPFHALCTLRSIYRGLSPKGKLKMEGVLTQVWQSFSEHENWLDKVIVHNPRYGASPNRHIIKRDVASWDSRIAAVLCQRYFRMEITEQVERALKDDANVELYYQLRLECTLDVDTGRFVRDRVFGDNPRKGLDMFQGLPLPKKGLVTSETRVRKVEAQLQRDFSGIRKQRFGETSLEQIRTSHEQREKLVHLRARWAPQGEPYDPLGLIEPSSTEDIPQRFYLIDETLESILSRVGQHTGYWDGVGYVWVRFGAGINLLEPWAERAVRLMTRDSALRGTLDECVCKT